MNEFTQKATETKQKPENYLNISKPNSVDELMDIFSAQIDAGLNVDTHKIGLMFGVQKEDDWTLIEEHPSRAMVPGVDDAVVLETRFTFGGDVVFEMKQMFIETTELNQKIEELRNALVENQMCFVGKADGHMPMFGRVNRRHYHMHVGNVTREQYLEHMKKMQDKKLEWANKIQSTDNTPAVEVNVSVDKGNL